MEIQPRETAAPAPEPGIKALSLPGRDPEVPVALASDVDALVSDFLEQLDAVSASLAKAPALVPDPGSSPAISDSHSHWPASGQTSAAEQEVTADDATCAELDDELQRTLEEIESHARSKVIPLTLRDTPRTQTPKPAAAPPPPQPQAEAPFPEPVAPVETDSPEQESLPAVVAAGDGSPAATPRAAAAAPAAEEGAVRILTSPSHRPLGLRRLAIGLTVAALVIILAVLYFLFVSPSRPVGGRAEPPSAAQGTAGSVTRTDSQPSAADPAASPAVSAPTQQAPVNRPATPIANQALRSANRPAAGGATGRNNARLEPPATRPQSGRPAAGAPTEQPAVSAADRTPPPIVPNPVTSPPVAFEDAAATKRVEPPPPVSPPPQAAPGKAAAEPPASGTTAAETSKPPAQPPASLPSGRPAAGGAETTAAAPKGPAQPIATLAVPLLRVAPQYPPLAAKINVKGKVDLSIEIDERGNVVKASAVSGPLMLRPAAEDALMKWRFQPATLRGVNVRSTLNLSVDFKD